MKVKKAVIPAAGLGTRFLPATKAVPKEMLPLIDTPSIQLVVEEAVRAGLTDILIITARDKGAIEDHFDRAPELEALLEDRGKFDELKQIRELSDLAQIHTVRQHEALGLGHAVSVAEAHVERRAVRSAARRRPDPPVGAAAARDAAGARAVRAFRARRPGGLTQRDLGLRRDHPRDDRGEPRPRALGRREADGRTRRPRTSPRSGATCSPPRSSTRSARPSPAHGGEIQLTDAINSLAQEQAVYAFTFEHGRYDAGNKLDYLKATVELAIERDDLGPAFSTWLVDFVQRKKLL